jgi:hydrogenase maturation protein HypF
MALSYLSEIFDSTADFPRIGPLEKIGSQKRKSVMEMIRTGLRTPKVSSCGRLFDAVSFLCGLAPEEMEYEAEAAMALEAAAQDPTEARYRFVVEGSSPPYRISFEPTFRGILRDLERGESVSRISAKFHNTLASLIRQQASGAREALGIETVVLVGGVFLNRRLLERTSQLLEKDKFRVLRPRLYSPSDESLSLGQIAYGLARIKGSRGQRI